MKKKVAIVGATGIAGQQFVTALANHPIFEIKILAASERSAGKIYIDAIKQTNGQISWWQNTPIPDSCKNMHVELASNINLEEIDLIFTATDSETAKALEPIYALQKPTISTASAFRMDNDVPLLIPGINQDHHQIIKRQQEVRGWKGFIVPIPNCTTYGLACSLAPIKPLGIKKVFMTSLQAISGAGRQGGVLALDMIDNIIPHIPGEEQKVESETRKILGLLKQDRTIEDANFIISSTCMRVPVSDGHTESVFVETHKKPNSIEELKELYQNYDAKLGQLPSGPSDFFMVHNDPFHPQPKIDRDFDDGMSTHIGRLRIDHSTNLLKYVLLSHNTKAGAAKGAILVAEWLEREGYF